MDSYVRDKLKTKYASIYLLLFANTTVKLGPSSQAKESNGELKSK